MYQTLFHSGIAHLLPVAFGLSDPAASLRSRSRLAGTITKVGGSTGDTDRLCPYFGHILSVSIVFFVIPHVMRCMSFRNQLSQRTHTAGQNWQQQLKSNYTRQSALCWLKVKHHSLTYGPTVAMWSKKQKTMLTHDWQLDTVVTSNSTVSQTASILF